MTNTNPNPAINLAEISTRNTRARHIVVAARGPAVARRHVASPRRRAR